MQHNNSTEWRSYSLVGVASAEAVGIAGVVLEAASAASGVAGVRVGDSEPDDAVASDVETGTGADGSGLGIIAMARLPIKAMARTKYMSLIQPTRDQSVCFCTGGLRLPVLPGRLRGPFERLDLLTGIAVSYHTSRAI
jgi:hypothetical protein